MGNSRTCQLLKNFGSENWSHQFWLIHDGELWAFKAFDVNVNGRVTIFKCTNKYTQTNGRARSRNTDSQLYLPLIDIIIFYSHCVLFFYLFVRSFVRLFAHLSTLFGIVEWSNTKSSSNNNNKKLKWKMKHTKWWPRQRDDDGAAMRIFDAI